MSILQMDGLNTIAKASATEVSKMAGTPRKKLVVEGLCSPPVTVFKEDGEVDLDSIPAMVQHFVDFGIRNAFVTGANGEALLMSVEERKRVAEKWIEAARGKLDKVIIQIGAGNLVESKELAKHAEAIGADAIACVGPTFFKPDNLECYVRYMAGVAAAAPNTPFMLYDNDVMTGIKFDTTEFFTLGKRLIPTLAGVKHTSPGMVSINSVRVNHPDMMLMMGNDEWFPDGLCIGVKGNITASHYGHVHTRLIAALERGDMEAARLEQGRILSAHAIRHKLGLMNVPGSKAMLRVLGMPVGDPRLPLAPVPEETVQTLKEELTAIGFFDWACRK